jgi:hypothetical protein
MKIQVGLLHADPAASATGAMSRMFMQHHIARQPAALPDKITPLGGLPAEGTPITVAKGWQLLTRSSFSHIVYSNQDRSHSEFGF